MSENIHRYKSKNVDPYCFFFFNDTATTEIYTLSLHDALPICVSTQSGTFQNRGRAARQTLQARGACSARSEEHTSELQSPCNLVCRLLLEKKKLDNTHPVLLSKITTDTSMRPMNMHTVVATDA